MLAELAWVSLASNASHRDSSSVVTRRRGDAKNRGVMAFPFASSRLRVSFH